jgi:hypothetical protein
MSKRQPSEVMEGGPLVRGITFGDAFFVANGALDPAMETGGNTKELADWLDFGPLLTRGQQQAIAGLLRLVPDKWTHGVRGKNKIPRQPRSQRAHQIALKVMERQQTRREQTGKTNVKDEDTEAFITDEIAADHASERARLGSAAAPPSSVEQVKGLLKNKKRIVKITRPRITRPSAR